MTTQYCRDLFSEKGLTYQNINKKKILHLKKILELELIKFKYDNPEINLSVMKTGSKSNKGIFNKDGSVNKYFLRVKGSYFSDREAISFNEDGFIGFAGWADSKNVQPILNAFVKWVEII